MGISPSIIRRSFPPLDPGFHIWYRSPRWRIRYYYPRAWYRSVSWVRAPPSAYILIYLRWDFFLCTNWLAESARAWVSNSRWKIDEQWNMLNPMRDKKNWRQEPGGEKGRHLWPRLVQKLEESRSVQKSIYILGRSLFFLCVFLFLLQLGITRASTPLLICGRCEAFVPVLVLRCQSTVENCRLCCAQKIAESIVVREVTESVVRVW